MHENAISGDFMIVFKLFFLSLYRVCAEEKLKRHKERKDSVNIEKMWKWNENLPRDDK